MNERRPTKLRLQRLKPLNTQQPRQTAPGFSELNHQQSPSSEDAARENHLCKPLLEQTDRQRIEPQALS